MDTKKLKQLGKDLTAIAIDLEEAEKTNVMDIMIDLELLIEEINKIYTEERQKIINYMPKADRERFKKWLRGV